MSRSVPQASGVWSQVHGKSAPEAALLLPQRAPLPLRHEAGWRGHVGRPVTDPVWNCRLTQTLRLQITSPCPRRAKLETPPPSCQPQEIHRHAIQKTQGLGLLHGWVCNWTFLLLTPALYRESYLLEKQIGRCLESWGRLLNACPLFQELRGKPQCLHGLPLETTYLRVISVFWQQDRACISQFLRSDVIHCAGRSPECLNSKGQLNTPRSWAMLKVTAKGSCWAPHKLLWCRKSWKKKRKA